MRDDRFWPRDIAEVEDKVSLINEPLSVPDDTTALPTVYRERPLHAVLCESLKQTKELLTAIGGAGRVCAEECAPGGGAFALCCDQKSGQGAGSLLGA